MSGVRRLRAAARRASRTVRTTAPQLLSFLSLHKGQGAKEKRSAARLAKQQAWLLANGGDATAAPGLKGFAGFQGEGEKKEPPTPTPSE